jgi:uncharacterized cupin superfamily protein
VTAGRPNIFEPHFDADQSRPGFAYRRARLGRQAGSKRIGTSLYELPPGEASAPYHWHAANEEMLVVLAGEPSLRTPAGWRQLRPGEMVAFHRGPEGAHQIQNRREETARVLLLSEMNAPELVVYPDSDKLGVLSKPPGSPGDEDEIAAWFRLDDRVDYWEGEEAPEDAP